MVEKTLLSSFSGRSCSGQELLDKIIQGETERDAFDKFSTEIVQCLNDRIATVAKKYKLNSSKRAKLWTEFHKIRLDRYSRPSLVWKELLQTLNTEVQDPLLYQSLLSELFEVLLKEHFQESNSRQQGEQVSIELTTDELNVLRYACGYVARVILKKYEKKSGEVASQYIQCLGDMAVEGEGEDLQEYTKKWFEIVNRGGLYPLNDETFRFFVQIEKKVKVLLPKHAVTVSDKDTFKDSVVDKIVEDEDVDFTWTLISQDIYNPDDSEALLLK